MSEDKQFLQSITIPEYIIKVQTSKKQRKRYYSKKSKKTWDYDESQMEGYEAIKKDYNGPPYKLPAPKTKLIKVYEGNYQWKGRYLADANGERLVANSQQAGTPNYEKLSGNRFASGFGSHHIRNTLVHGLKDFYRPFVHQQLKPIKDDQFPLWIDWHLYTTIPKRMFDLTNFWFYYKYFEDCLFETEDPNGNKLQPIIPDDNIEFITKPGVAPILHPIADWEHRKFVFKIYKDNRSCLQSHKLYQK